MGGYIMSLIRSWLLLIALPVVISACGGGENPPASSAIPIADAGVDQLVAVDTVVTLDGSGSTDPEDDALTYSWTITARPDGSV
ncbi:hypothetical protein MNBD_GAMMA25-1961, partial [hydrothermal vent metagenome]